MKTKRFTNSHFRQHHMKPLFTILVLFLIICNVAAQNYTLASTKVYSIPQQERVLEDILHELELKYNINFMYESETINGKSTGIEFNKEEKIENILSKLLKPLKLNYKKIDQHTFLIKPKAEKENDTDKKKSGHSQGTNEGTPDDNQLIDKKVAEIFGKVVDENNLALPGVNVSVKGSVNGTTTDQDGKYKLVVNEGGQTLIFSFIGYTTQEILIGNQTEINVSMVADIKTLNEVVVIGYGTQKKIELTGAISSVQGKEVNALPVRSIAESLQGRAAGVEVSKGDGSPGGGGTKIQIRGAASINGSDPLILVDGVRVGTGFDFNMRDVERIDILKDGSSAAIYGREAAGGVILVTTKRGGKSDKINVSANAYYGVRNVRRHYDLLNTPDYITTRKVYLKDDPSFKNPSSLPNTNWYNELYKPAAEKNINLSISGGTEKLKYYISGSYLREDGVRVDNWSERFSLRINTDLQVSKRFKISPSVYIRKSNDNPTYSSDIPFRSIPTMQARDSLGNFGKAPGYFQGGNPLGSELIHLDKNTGFSFNGNLTTDWEIINGLNFKTILAMNNGNGTESHYTSPYDFGNNQSSQNIYSLKQKYDEDYQINLILNYKKQIGLHEFSVMGGMESRKSLNNFSIKGTSLNTLTSPTQTFNTDTSKIGYNLEGGLGSPFRYLSYFGRLTYNYASKYFLTANIRQDGAFEFPKVNQYDIFPSVSVAWRINEEGFLKDLPVLSNLKLRAGYGILGNDPLSSINQFAYKSFYGSNSAVSFADGKRSVGYGVTGLSNTQLRWEKVKSTNIGLDIGLFKDKLNVTLDYYIKNTEKMIYSVIVPLSSGFNNQAQNTNTSVPINIGTLQNKGLEASVNYRNNLGDFTYNISANASFNRNNLSSINGLDVTEIRSGGAGDTWFGNISNSKQGQALAQFYGYVVEGIYQSDSDVKNRKVVQNVNTGAGDLIYKDLNGDGVIDDKDKTFIGNPWPKMVYGFTFNLGYKRFDMTLFFQGVNGVSLYNGAKGYTNAVYSDYNTTSEIFGTSFFNGGGLTDKPRAGAIYTDEDGNKGFADVNGNYKNISSYFVENGSYLKLKNFQVGYSIPKVILERAKISNLRIYFQAQNLLTFTKYKGLDPEIGWSINGANGDIQRGIDSYGTYPRTRLYSLGLDINF